MVKKAKIDWLCPFLHTDFEIVRATDSLPVTFVTQEQTRHPAVCYVDQKRSGKRSVMIFIEGAQDVYLLQLNVADFLWSQSDLEVLFWKHPITVGSKAYRLHFMDYRQRNVFMHSL